MRQITVRFPGECRECGKEIDAGAEAIYERRVGLFCLSCEPTDPEKIREYRQEAADHKADRYEEWAAKRRSRANATLEHNRRFTSDIAFNTQPGHIPMRARIIRQDDRACESLRTAERFEEKAQSLRRVRVAGDAERRRQAVRDVIRPLLKKGMKVHTAIYGLGTVEKVNKKTATVKDTGASGTYRVNVDLSWIRIVEEGAA